MRGGEVDTDVLSTIVGTVGQKYTRRGMFGLLAKGGLLLAGAIGGVTLAGGEAFACFNPPPTCSGPCSCSKSSCTLSGCGTWTCSCGAGCGNCTPRCVYAYVYMGNGCACGYYCNACSNC